jgi:hypothetical protein
MTPEEVSSALAAWRVPGASATLPGEPLPEDEWAILLEIVARARLWGLLGVAVATGDLPATDAQAAQAEARHQLAMHDALELEAVAVGVSRALAERGVSTRLLKGLAVAHLDERDAAFRCFADVDILVRRTDLPRSILLLGELGFDRSLPERHRGFDARFAKDATLWNEPGHEVDVHASLALGAFGLSIDQDDLWAASETVVLAGTPFEALDRSRRALHAAYTVVLGDPTPRLVSMRDLALLLTDPRADLSEIRRIASRWRAEVVLAAAVKRTAATLAADRLPLSEWAGEHEPSGWERRALAAYRSQGGSNSAVLLSGALAPMPLRDRAAYLWAFARPSRAYVAARRSERRPAELRTGLRELLRRR